MLEAAMVTGIWWVGPQMLLNTLQDSLQQGTIQPQMSRGNREEDPGS